MENFRCQSHPDYLMKWSEINRGNSMKKEVEQFGQKKKKAETFHGIQLGRQQNS